MSYNHLINEMGEKNSSPVQKCDKEGEHKSIGYCYYYCYLQNTKFPTASQTLCFTVLNFCLLNRYKMVFVVSVLPCYMMRFVLSFYCYFIYFAVPGLIVACGIYFSS